MFPTRGNGANAADDFFAVIPHRTAGTTKTNPLGAQRGSSRLSYKIPGGGLISSADDMAHFEAAILADKLIKHATRELMWTRRRRRMASRPATDWDGTADKFGVHIVATRRQQGTAQPSRLCRSAGGRGGLANMTAELRRPGGRDSENRTRPSRSRIQK